MAPAGRPTMACRRVFRRQRQHDRRAAAHAQPRDEPKRKDVPRLRGARRRKRRQPEHRHADQRRRTAADSVAHQAQRHGAHRHADDARREDRRQFAGLQLECRQDRRPGERHCLRVKAIEQRDQKAQGKDAPLKGAHPFLIDQARNGEG